jgi:hypothetical protein
LINLDNVTVGIITHPARIHNGMLARALESVERQTRIPEVVSIRVDTNHEGAPVMRQRLLDGVTTKWLAWLDSDDEFLPHHLETLLAAAHEQQADYVYSWYRVEGGEDPRPLERALPWSDIVPRQTSIVTLVDAQKARQAGGYLVDGDINAPDRKYAGEDWKFTQRAVAAGMKIYKVPDQITWVWHHHAENSSGLPKFVK